MLNADKFDDINMRMKIVKSGQIILIKYSNIDLEKRGQSAIITLKQGKEDDCMNPDIIGAAVAAATGMLIAFANYLISKRILVKAPEKYSVVTVVRQVIQVGFLAVVYFVGTKTELADPIYLLVGAVLGMAVPMFFFTKKLLSVNESLSLKKKNEKEDENG